VVDLGKVSGNTRVKEGDMKAGYLTIAQAADYLGVSSTSLRRWHDNGRLVPAKVDRATRYRYYSLDQLNRYREAHEGQRNGAQSRRATSFTFIDLFAGIGGFRLALEAAGGSCVFTSEIDRFACKTYAANFDHWPDGDITQIHESEIPSHDVLVAGFPCQPFSIAGVSKYGSLGRGHGFLDITKGTLFFDIIRILNYHRPKAFLLENVKNLRSHDRGKTWLVIQKALDELGYNWYDSVLDASSLVPQHRERIFVVGFREAATFHWPHLPSNRPRVRDILEQDVDDRYTLSDHLWDYLQRYAAKHRQKGNGFGYGLVDPDGITRTLSARYYKDGSEILVPQPGRNPRRLTPRECARLMGFPDDFSIPVSDTQAYKQFGNAVVVPLAASVADSLSKALPAEAESQIRGARQQILPEIESIVETQARAVVVETGNE
jgi:DNA (cytosine-5)-methyltransferase 1